MIFTRKDGSFIITVDALKIHLRNSCEPFCHFFFFQSAVSLTVGVGSMSEPANIPGLAHYLEHSWELHSSLLLLLFSLLLFFYVIIITIIIIIAL